MLHVGCELEAEHQLNQQQEAAGWQSQGTGAPAWVDPSGAVRDTDLWSRSSVEMQACVREGKCDLKCLRKMLVCNPCPPHHREILVCTAQARPKAPLQSVGQVFRTRDQTKAFLGCRHWGLCSLVHLCEGKGENGRRERK